MSYIDEKIEALIYAVKESTEYKEYQKVRNLVHLEPEKEKAIHEFRRRSFELQRQRDVDLYSEMDRLEKEFAPLRAEPYVNVCRMIQRINYRLMEEIEFDLGFE